LDAAPANVRTAFFTWVEIVEQLGLLAAKRIPGFRDEKLRGERIGQHSIRLNKAWRAYYVIQSSKKFELIEVIEVNKHVYKTKK